MSEEIRNKLTAVYKTLDSMEVTGRKNVEKLLGCMMAVESILKDINDRKDSEPE